jgi:transglycosylase-like protein with SLT domain
MAGNGRIGLMTKRLRKILIGGAMATLLLVSAAAAAQSSGSDAQLPPATISAAPAESGPAFQQGDTLAAPPSPASSESEGSGGTTAKPEPAPKVPAPAPEAEPETGGQAEPETAEAEATETLAPSSSEAFEIGSVPSSSCASAGVPPILIPIYQRAAATYGLGPQGPAVLAGINEIETAFGTNLNTSYAGAMGWMQFIQSTWEMYGVDANGDGVKDPYNPEDAIFAAARYLSAAGMPADTYGAIYSYNHADWYVAEVLENAACYAGVVGAPSIGGLSLSPQHEVLTCTPAADWRDAVPADYLEAFETAAARYELGRRGVWALAAVARLESDFGRGMTKEEMRTKGPLGLDPTEWSTYAVDGDEDGRVRHADPADSAATLARLIWSRGSLRAGIFTHNQAEWYVQAVLADAEQVKGSCETTNVDWRVALPGGSGAPIDWSHLTLSNDLELRDLTTGALDPRIMALIGAITQEHELRLSALRSDHSELTSTGYVSNHFYGRAMDIAEVDGVSCTDTSPDAPCGELAHSLSQITGPLHPTELIYCYDVDGPGPAFALPDHCDHVHVGFDG